MQSEKCTMSSIARSSDVALIVAGIEEGEFRDRAFLGLPGHQEELIERVGATGTPVVVVTVGWEASRGCVVPKFSSLNIEHSFVLCRCERDPYHKALAS